jgi:hypothetical protein
MTGILSAVPRDARVRSICGDVETDVIARGVFEILHGEIPYGPWQPAAAGKNPPEGFAWVRIAIVPLLAPVEVYAERLAPEPRP